MNVNSLSNSRSSFPLWDGLYARHSASLAGVALAALLVASAPLAHAAEITLPTEKVRLADSALPGATLATALCYTCHSAEYVLYQPTTSGRAYWRATVVKMQKVFGAPIPDTAIDPIADYLVKLYGTDAAAPASTSPAPTAPAPASNQSK